MATGRVLSIGTELTRGELVNSNAAYLSAGLTAAGIRVIGIDTVDDHPDRIRAALSRSSGADVLVCTGGLGPTTDDLTTLSVAEHLGLPLEEDIASVAAIRARLERFGYAMSITNRKQALFPKGAQILANPNGTAPGFSIRIGYALAFFLPGVPSEMAAMFEANVLPAVAPLVDETFFQVVLRAYGLPEAEVGERLSGVEEAFGVTIGYRASFPTLEVKLLAQDRDRARAEERAQSAANEVRSRLGPIVFGEGNVTFAQTLGRELAKRGLRIAVAESCTAGLLGQLLTERAGASAFFLGGVSAYADPIKSLVLGVDPELVRGAGAVSREVARAMAEGALQKFGAELALGITGIAGPDGGSPEKPVGLVHLAAATLTDTFDESLVFAGERGRIRLRAAYAAISLALRVVRGELTRASA